MNKDSIITADDHPLLLKGLNDFLIEKKYNLIGSGNNGKEAYQLIVEEKPDIAILDIQMPHMSGLEIAMTCKANELKTKIVLITLHKERELYQKAQDLNIFGYILIEFDLEQIEHCINTISKGDQYYSYKIVELLAYDYTIHTFLTHLHITA